MPVTAKAMTGTFLSVLFYVKLTEIDKENIDKEDNVKNDFKTRKPA